MSCVISVLSTDNAFHSPSIVVTTEFSRFLFDVGEGTQRLVMEHKVRVGKVRAVCTTSAHIRCLGGLTGMLLTLGDAGVGKMDVMGPMGVRTFVDGVKNFTRPLDNYFLPNIDSKTGFLAPYETKDLTLVPVALGLPILPLEQCRHFCYIGETPQIAGKFYVEKALELGVPKGPIFGKLKNGFPVTLPDGRIIEPSQVVGEPTLSQNFVIVPCLHLKDDALFLQYLFDEPMMRRFQPKHSGKDKIQVMLHLSSQETVTSPQYEVWMATFGTTTKHIFVGTGMNKDVTQTSYIAERIYNHKLASLYANMFPVLLNPASLQSTSSSLLPSTMVDNSGDTTENMDTTARLLSEQRIHGEVMLKYHLLPIRRAGIDRTEIPISPNACMENTQEEFAKSIEPDLLHRAKLYRDEMNLQLTKSTQPENVRFYFLGTGCAIPSKYRNVSSTLVYFHASHSAMMFDCGEGSWHQLLRLTPPTISSSISVTSEDIACEWARLVKLVWISHLHADHHLGLVHLILQRKQRLSSAEFRPLYIISPMYVLRFLEEVSVMMPEIIGAFVGIPSNCFDPTDLLCTECTSEDSIIAQLQRNTLESSSVLSSETDIEEMTENTPQDPEEDSEHNNNSNTTNSNDTIKSEESMRKRRKIRDSRYRPRVVAATAVTTSISPSSSVKAVASTFLDSSSLVPPSCDVTLPTRTKVLMSMISSAFKSTKQLLQDMGIVELINVPVIHCIQANGLVLSVRKTKPVNTDESTDENKEDDILKIVYSGDTRPCETLIYWGQDAHILLHEATFEDDKISEAVHKKHSTINEAVEVARLMHAPHLILTHFSQRYHGIPMQFHPQYPYLLQMQQQLLQQDVVIAAPSSSQASIIVHVDKDTTKLPSMPSMSSLTHISAVSNVVVAFDFMTVSDRELTLAKGMTPLLAEIFPALPVPGEDDEDFLTKEDVVIVESK